MLQRSLANVLSVTPNQNETCLHGMVIGVHNKNDKENQQDAPWDRANAEISQVKIHD